VSHVVSTLHVCVPCRVYPSRLCPMSCLPFTFVSLVVSTLHICVPRRVYPSRLPNKHVLHSCLRFHPCVLHVPTRKQVNIDFIALIATPAILEFRLLHFISPVISSHGGTSIVRDVIKTTAKNKEVAIIICWSAFSTQLTGCKRRLNCEQTFALLSSYTAVFVNRRAAARYRALASIIPGRERFSWN
jgi:hypothetical protein